MQRLIAIPPGPGLYWLHFPLAKTDGGKIRAKADNNPVRISNFFDIFATSHLRMTNCPTVVGTTDFIPVRVTVNSIIISFASCCYALS